MNVIRGKIRNGPKLFTRRSLIRVSSDSGDKCDVHVCERDKRMDQVRSLGSTLLFIFRRHNDQFVILVSCFSWQSRWVYLPWWAAFPFVREIFILLESSDVVLTRNYYSRGSHSPLSKHFQLAKDLEKHLRRMLCFLGLFFTIFISIIAPCGILRIRRMTFRRINFSPSRRRYHDYYKFSSSSYLNYFLSSCSLDCVKIFLRITSSMRYRRVRYIKIMIL